MSMISAFAMWVSLIFMQFSPPQNMEIGDTVKFTNNEITFEFTLTDVPYEEYWDCEAVVYQADELMTTIKASGYTNQLFSMKSVLPSGDEIQLFSVNDAGGPLILGPSEGVRHGVVPDLIYLVPDASFEFPFIATEEFEFKGGKDYIHTYSAEGIEVDVTMKEYNSSGRFGLTMIEFRGEEFGDEAVRFWITY